MRERGPSPGAPATVPAPTATAPPAPAASGPDTPAPVAGAPAAAAKPAPAKPAAPAPPHADIDDASRAELQRILREAEREEARRR